MRHWTPEERQRQRELIRGWQPWNSSSGSKTPEGRQISSMNALKHGGHSRETRAIRTLLRHARKLLESLDGTH